MLPRAKKISPTNIPKPKALTCHSISKDGRKIHGRIGNKESTAITFVIPRQKERRSCEKVTIFLLLIWSWGWSNFVGGILFLFSFDFIYFFSFNLRHQFVSVDWWDLAAIYWAWNTQTDSAQICTWARWRNLRGRFIIPTFLFGCLYLHSCIKFIISAKALRHVYYSCAISYFPALVNKVRGSYLLFLLVPRLDHSIALFINNFSTLPHLFISFCSALQLSLKRGEK